MTGELGASARLERERGLGVGDVHGARSDGEAHALEGARADARPRELVAAGAHARREGEHRREAPAGAAHSADADLAEKTRAAAIGCLDMLGRASLDELERARWRLDVMLVELRELEPDRSVVRLRERRLVVEE